MKSEYRISGHDNQLSYIENAIEKNKLDNSIMLIGTYGIGKSLFANIIAEKILSVNGSMLTNYEANIFHIKAHEDSKSGEINIEQIRKLNHLFNHTSANDNYRIIIIDAVDDLNINATNALLKMLEEPPANTLFILINHVSAKSISTIASRCLKLKLYDLTSEQSYEILQNSDIDRAQLDKLNYIAENSPGRAIDLSENDGLQIYDLIIEILVSNSSDKNELMLKITKIICGSKNDNIWRAFEFIYLTSLSRIFKLGLVNNYNEQTKREFEASIKLKDKYNIDEFYRKFQSYNEDIRLTSLLNLDKKSCVLKVFDW